MNKVLIMGRLVKNPEVRYSDNSTAIARYTLAVDRRKKDSGADFINCVAFMKNAEFAEKWLAKGMKIVIEGRIQTGSYTDKEGKTVYTQEVVVENQEFAEAKKMEDAPSGSGEGFTSFADVDDADLPFASPSR